MSRLSAGGRVAAGRRSTPPNCARPSRAPLPKRLTSEPACRCRLRPVCPRVVGIALVVLAAAIPARAADGDAQAPAQPEVRAVVSFAAPLVPLAGSDKTRDGRAMERPTGQDAHWTLRSPVYVRTSGAETMTAGETVSGGETVGPAPQQTGRTGRAAGMRTADVAMFSWKEIAAVGLVLAFVLGALLALTGGGARRPSQRPSKDY